VITRETERGPVTVRTDPPDTPENLGGPEQIDADVIAENLIKRGGIVAVAGRVHRDSVRERRSSEPPPPLRGKP